MTPNTIWTRALEAVAREQEQACAADPALFALAVGYTLDPWQARVCSSPAREAIWCCSRQSGKSLAAAIAATHTALYDEGSTTLLLSPSLRQSGELYAKCLSIMRAAPGHPAVAAATATRIEVNGSRIISLPGAAETVRGFTADLVIIDEAAHCEATDLLAATRPMLATKPGGKLRLLSTPFGTRGAFHSIWTTGGDGWERTRVPASECPRISEEWLLREKRALGAWLYDQEYNCAFGSTHDSVFRLEDIEAAFDPTIKALFTGSWLDPEPEGRPS